MQRSVIVIVAALCLVVACDASNGSKHTSSTTLPKPSVSSSVPSSPGVSTSSTASVAPVTDPVFAATATFTGPVAGKPVDPQSVGTGALPAGYVEQEYFAAGTAHAFTGSTPKNGLWTPKPGTTASYRTRILVRRPSDPAKFNGTVVVEWLNESSGESPPDWLYLSPMLTDDGYAYVGVSAQQISVSGGNTVGGTAVAGLAKTDPKRYGSLHHPGDAYALDIFAQIGRGLRAATTGPLAGLQAKHIVATGESQSAFFVAGFADALQKQTHAYDGIFVHSRGGTIAGVGTPTPVSGGSPGGERIRTDLDIPVFQFETETDVSFLGFSSARQPDTAHVRTWEVAGTSHADAFLAGPYVKFLNCTEPINSGPQHYVEEAAFTAFTAWVAGGAAPPAAKPMRITGTSPVHIERDAGGNAVGGVRTPAVDVPVSALSGEPQAGNPACLLLGSTKPYSAAELATRYGSSAGYVARFRKSLRTAVAGGFLRAADEGELLAAARKVHIA